MSFRDLLFHNFGWKLLSLVLAALTWFYIQTGLHKNQILLHSPVITESKRVFTDLPIKLMTAVGNTNIYKISPLSATVEVSGDHSLLEKMQASEIELFVDLTQGEEEKPLRKEVQIHAPKDVVVLSIRPLYVDVERYSEAAQ